ncbi:hypothetical protein CP967_00040 [Streptomyces nitrosporeus]|uniref:Uncharacterized protein n=1 Tax=Streptomyces nitrosporeus TaxID=28894 RepID=A0A5J6F2R2_9ACTN|nr:hypothetical protein [Streptomyces nitrosporeus]QEU70569.1 hypothetical protein CP967_00040 [Streptomyces nitrosporeus]GGZ30128.1 hypothetical protein GCM10010327_70430 [Streptomyces nitrosporeus]
MPKYDEVPQDPQLPSKQPTPDADPYRSFTSELPVSVARALRATAALRGATVKSLLTEAVTDYLTREGVPLPHPTPGTKKP